MNKISINGSPFPNGTVGKVLSGIGIPIVHLTDGIDKAKRAVVGAEVILFATPVYWFNVSALIKALLEALPEGPKFPCEGKIAYLLAVGDEDGGQQAVNQMFGPLSHMGFSFPPYASQFINTKMRGKSEGRWQDNAPAFLRRQIRRIS